MSIDLMRHAWDTTLPLSAKFLLVALADQANDAGDCYPSIERICKRCSMSERTTQALLAQLERLGYLQRFFRAGRSTVYRISQPETWKGGSGSGSPAAAAQGARATPADSAPPQNSHPRRIRTPAADAPAPAVSAGAPANAAPIIPTSSSLNQKQRANAQERKAAPTETERPTEGNSPERGREPTAEATSNWARQLHSLGKITAAQLRQCLADVDVDPAAVAEQLSRATRTQQAAA